MKHLQITSCIFGKPGKENTQKTIEIAAQKAEEGNIETILSRSLNT